MMKSERLVDSFDRLVARAPTRPLVVSSRHRVTASALAALARAAGRALAEAPGLAPGEPVGLQAVNGPGFLAALVALRRAGCAVLLLDSGTPELERSRVAIEVGARFVLTCGRVWAETADDFRVHAVSADRVAVTLPPEVAVVKLTSGSTGAARGIAVSAAALVADDRQLAATMGIGAGDRLLATIPFSHSYGFCSLVIPALVRGAVLVLPAVEGPFGPLQAAAAAAATVFPSVPAYLHALTRLADPPPLPPSLRLVMSAGAPLSAEISALFRARFGRGVHVFYGASESGGICYDREGGAAERGTVGSPIDGVTVELAPVEQEQAGAGRVVVTSPAVARGYLPPSPDRLGQGRYVTDDLAFWRDGELVLAGRLNDLINVRGKKVNPREVEAVLGRLAGVEEALVLAVPGTGPREQRVRAVVACRPGALSSRQVVDFCRRHLADHKVPRSVVLVDELPRTERGKVDRAALMAWRPVAPGGGLESDSARPRPEGRG